MDVLSNLVDRSFVIREGTSGTARYRLHETMREFALLRLLEADEEAAARDAHLAFFSGLCRFTEVDVAHPDVASKLAWLDELDRRSGQHPRRVAELPRRPRRRRPGSDDGGRPRAVLEKPSRDRGSPLDRCPPRPSW